MQSNCKQHMGSTLQCALVRLFVFFFFFLKKNFFIIENRCHASYVNGFAVTCHAFVILHIVVFLHLLVLPPQQWSRAGSTHSMHYLHFLPGAAAKFRTACRLGERGASWRMAAAGVVAHAAPPVLGRVTALGRVQRLQPAGGGFELARLRPAPPLRPPCRHRRRRRRRRGPAPTPFSPANAKHCRCRPCCRAGMPAARVAATGPTQHGRRRRRSGAAARAWPRGFPLRRAPPA